MKTGIFLLLLAATKADELPDDSDHALRGRKVKGERDLQYFGHYFGTNSISSNYGKGNDGKGYYYEGKGYDDGKGTDDGKGYEGKGTEDGKGMTASPSHKPTPKPTRPPTPLPTRPPTPPPTPSPTPKPTLSPTHAPTPKPTNKPTEAAGKGVEEGGKGFVFGKGLLSGGSLLERYSFGKGFGGGKGFGDGKGFGGKGLFGNGGKGFGFRQLSKEKEPKVVDDVDEKRERNLQFYPSKGSQSWFDSFGEGSDVGKGLTYEDDGKGLPPVTYAPKRTPAPSYYPTPTPPPTKMPTTEISRWPTPYPTSKPTSKSPPTKYPTMEPTESAGKGAVEEYDEGKGGSFTFSKGVPQFYEGYSVQQFYGGDVEDSFGGKGGSFGKGSFSFGKGSSRSRRGLLEQRDAPQEVNDDNNDERILQQSKGYLGLSSGGYSSHYGKGFGGISKGYTDDGKGSYYYDGKGSYDDGKGTDIGKGSTSSPSKYPTPPPTRPPTKSPTKFPTPLPTPKPTSKPTPGPTRPPTPVPTPKPTSKPTPFPTEAAGKGLFFGKGTTEEGGKGLFFGGKGETTDFYGGFSVRQFYDGADSFSKGGSFGKGTNYGKGGFRRRDLKEKE